MRTMTNMADSPTIHAANYDDFSSPDPLATSTNDQPAGSSPTKPKTRVRHSKSSSQSSRISSSISYQPNSPSRTVTEQTISPWKIRVTVETEPENGVEGKMQTVTRTTQIPLKEESSPLQKGSKRSGSRIGSPATGRQRSLTPGGSRRRKQSVTDLDIIVLGDDAEEDEWGKKPSPKKKKPAVKRRQSKTPTDFEVQQIDVETGEKLRSKSPELRQIDLDRVSVRQRANSTRNQDAEELIPSTEITQIQEKGIRKVSTNSTRSYPTPSPTPSGPDHEPEQEGFDTIMESEGFTMIDLDSIPSVKQLRSSPAEESSPSEKEGSVVHTIPIQETNKNMSRLIPPKPFPSYLTLAEGESDITSGIASSPPVKAQPIKGSSKLQVPVLQRNRLVTPLTHSSPKLPSPPRPIPVKERSVPNSAEALRATQVLQDALEPHPFKPMSSSATKTPVSHVRSSSEELFEGFDSSTQREMRAGLRFGEELAKRQNSSISDTQVWRGEHVVHHTPLVSMATKDVSLPLHDQSLEGEKPLTATISAPSPPLRNPPGGSVAAVMNTEKKREQRWQDERSAVIKQAKEASPSKVIVIDSDDEEVVVNDDLSLADELTEDDGDIWLEEAKDSSSSPRAEPDEHPTEEPDKLLEKPRRSLIPSPWKRGEQIPGNESTVLTTGDGESAMSGLFWKQPQDQDLKFGARQLKTIRKELKTGTFRTNRSGSGSFDLDKMAGTPKKTDDAVELEEESSLEPGSEESVDEMEQEDSSVSGDTPVQQMDAAPVNVDDSIVSEAVTPVRPTTPSPHSMQQPITPRSAMKGGRKSFGIADVTAHDQDSSDQTARRVVWARRARHVDEDWVESSRSIRDEDIMSLQSPVEIGEPSSQHEYHQPLAAGALQHNEQYDWGEERNSSTKLSIAQVPQHDGPSESPSHNEGQWHRTSKSPLTSAATSLEDQTPTTHPQPNTSNYHLSKPKPSSSKIPSYLLPPSYPSDPTRPATTPLSTSGPFTNTHFRTLHIIYRKSLRPRFHAPSTSELRPEIKHLVSTKWTLLIDENGTGLGGFEFKIGILEGRVLERFCREVEWGLVLSRVIDDGGDDENVRRKVGKRLIADGGIWDGACAHGAGQVKWEWNCEMLAAWLGRIVVGEVVREEEGGASSGKKK